jgi:hypothetical protein
MIPTSRLYQTKDDFWRMREFLRQVFLLNDCHERSWHVARLGCRSVDLIAAFSIMIIINSAVLTPTYEISPDAWWRHTLLPF